MSVCRVRAGRPTTEGASYDPEWGRCGGTFGDGGERVARAHGLQGRGGGCTAAGVRQRTQGRARCTGISELQMPWTLIAQWVCAHQDVDLSLEARGRHGGSASRHRRSDIRLTHGSEPLMCMPFFVIHTFHLMLVRSRRAHDISPHMFKLSSFFTPTRRTDGCSPSCGSSAASFCNRSFSPANPHVSCGGGGVERAALGCGCTTVASKGHQPPLGDGCRCGAATGPGSAGARPPRAGEGGAAYIRKPRRYHTVSLTDTLCLTTLGIPCLGGPFPFASHPLP